MNTYYHFGYNKYGKVDFQKRQIEKLMSVGKNISERNNTYNDIRPNPFGPGWRFSTNFDKKYTNSFKQAAAELGFADSFRIQFSAVDSYGRPVKENFTLWIKTNISHEDEMRVWARHLKKKVLT